MSYISFSILKLSPLHPHSHFSFSVKTSTERLVSFRNLSKSLLFNPLCNTAIKITLILSIILGSPPLSWPSGRGVRTSTLLSGMLCFLCSALMCRNCHSFRTNALVSWEGKGRGRRRAKWNREGGTIVTCTRWWECWNWSVRSPSSLHTSTAKWTTAYQTGWHICIACLYLHTFLTLQHALFNRWMDCACRRTLSDLMCYITHQWQNIPYQLAQAYPNLIPRPRPAFRRFQYGKAREGLVSFLMWVMSG